MAAKRFFNHKMAIVVCLAGFMWGCAPQEEPAGPSVKPVPKEAAPRTPAPGSIKLALKPSPGEQTGYKIATQVGRSIKWEGPVPAKQAFEETFNNEEVEMTVTQSIKNVKADGVAVAEVKIDSLKYVSIVKNQTILDFDSSRQSDANSPLAALVGQSYTIEIEPNNYVSSVSDLSMLKALMKERTAADRAGHNILSSDAIIERQSTLLLPQAGQEYLRPKDTWSTIKTFSFGMMGVKSYEKVWTLDEVRDDAGRNTAVISMSAIPSSEVEQKYRDQQAGANFPKMFDSKDTYAGSGVVDLTAGIVNSYHEELRTNWVTALPSDRAETADSNEPVVLKMTATRSYSLEKIK